MSPLYKKRAFPSATTATTSSTCTSELPGVLRRWQERGCQLAVWQRSLAPQIVEELDRTALQDFPSVRFTATSDEVGRKLGSAFSGSSLGDTALATALAHDMAHLVSLFASATGSRDVDVRLETVSDDACRRFHTDVTLARLVTTYVGPGTVWVPPEHAEDAMRLQENYSGPLNEMPRFAVGMFGGAESAGGGLVHRSPRIAGTGTSRLFFCVNRPFRSATDTI